MLHILDSNSIILLGGKNTMSMPDVCEQNKYISKIAAKFNVCGRQLKELHRVLCGTMIAWQSKSHHI